MILLLLKRCRRVLNFLRFFVGLLLGLFAAFVHSVTVKSSFEDFDELNKPAMASPPHFSGINKSAFQNDFMDGYVEFVGEKMIKRGIKMKTLVFPGTLWCGIGTIAKNDNHIGFFHATDSCCRAHDKCSDQIFAKETKYNLTNHGSFTRSHCNCDKTFYLCLKRLNSIPARQVGYTYFSLLGPPCFRNDYPIVSCARRVRRRCYAYVINNLANKTWQWFDNKLF